MQTWSRTDSSPCLYHAVPVPKASLRWCQWEGLGSKSVPGSNVTVTLTMGMLVPSLSLRLGIGVWMLAIVVLD